MHSNQNNWLKNTITKDSRISRSSISSRDSQRGHTIPGSIYTVHWSFRIHHSISLLIVIKTTLLHVMHAISKILHTLSFWHEATFTALEEVHNEQELKTVKWDMTWFYKNYQKTTSQINSWNNRASSVRKHRACSLRGRCFFCAVHHKENINAAKIWCKYK